MSGVRLYDKEHTVNVLYEEAFNQKAQKTSNMNIYMFDLAILINLPGIIYSITHASINPCILNLVQEDKSLYYSPAW